MSATSRVLSDLQSVRDLPAVFICARSHQPAHVDIDLTQTLREAAAEEMATVLAEASRKASARRFNGRPLTGFGAL